MDPRLILTSTAHDAAVYRTVADQALRAQEEHERAYIKSLASHIAAGVARALSGKK
jgi:hypothetical protein